MSYYYCKKCKKVYGCSDLVTQQAFCGICKNGCGMKSKMWKIDGFTFKEDDHGSLCSFCTIYPSKSIQPEGVLLMG